LFPYFLIRTDKIAFKGLADKEAIMLQDLI